MDRKNYLDFIQSKQFTIESSGFDIDKSELNPKMFDFEKDIVRWALAKGKAAIFSGCGLGKTICQLEWANKLVENRGGRVLIVAPLSVASQTVNEGAKFGIKVKLCRDQSDVVDGINITNYEMLSHFVAKEFIGVVLDESSILKAYSGKVRTQIIEMFAQTPYRLACTATPAPNDYMELGNHCEFLGVMSRTEMLSMYFIHDGGDTSKWRLKKHADALFWQWMATWAVFLENPKDLGYVQEGYDLPPLNVQECYVDGEPDKDLVLTLTERRDARRESLEARCQYAADLVNNSDEQWVVWCDLNVESDMLHKLIPDSVEVKGADTNEHKVNSFLGFQSGEIRAIVTKGSIAGYGLNWQNCHNVVFVGLSDSFEAYYQSVRRCWRFGQTKPVNVYLVLAAREGCVKANIERKQADMQHMRDEMSLYTKEITKKELQKTVRVVSTYNPQQEMEVPDWLKSESIA